MVIDMGWNSERETYQVITESQEVFESPDSPIMFRNEKGKQEGIIEWYPVQDRIIMKNCEGERENWKESSEYQEKKKLELFRDLRRQRNKFESAAEGDEWVLQNSDSAAQKAREYLIDNLCPMLKDRGRVNVAQGVKRLGEKGPKYGNLLQEFDTAVNRFEIKVRQEYGMDPDKIEIKHSNDKIVYQE